MELTNEQLELLERMGKNFFDFKKCAAALEVDEAKFFAEMKDRNSAAFKSYYTGFFTSELKHREGVLKISERGSNPAQQMVQKFIDEAGSNL